MAEYTLRAWYTLKWVGLKNKKKGPPAFLSWKVIMILMAARQKKKKARDTLGLVWIQIWNEGTTNLFDWKIKYDSFNTQLKNYGSNDLAAPDKETR